MPAVVTEAIVLHWFDYQENSRILRLLTRDAGVQSVLARGARNSRKRFGSAMGLFAGGLAHLTMRDGSDLHTLSAFDVQRVREDLATDYGRFTGACMLAELLLRFAGAEGSDELFETVDAAFASLAACESDAARTRSIGAAWRIVATLGFAPALSSCAICHAAVEVDAEVLFSHRAGGVVCERCGRNGITGRLLPAAARRCLIVWTESDSEPSQLSGAEARAHTRLLREFVAEHLGGERPLQAFELWAQVE